MMRRAQVRVRSSSATDSRAKRRLLPSDLHVVRTSSRTTLNRTPSSTALCVRSSVQ